MGRMRSMRNLEAVVRLNIKPPKSKGKLIVKLNEVASTELARLLA
jgi:hypothetical protein